MPSISNNRVSIKRSITNLTIVVIFTLVFPVAGQQVKLLGAAQSDFAWRLTIERLEPTVFFPRQPAGQPLKQRAILHLDNPNMPMDAVATITVGNNAPYQEDLGTVVNGKSAIPISILDIAEPSKVTVVVRDKYSFAVPATQQWTWQPQKKWKLFSVSYSHWDLGYGNYPHRVRTEIRHANIELPLKFCRETDSWDEDSKFRYMMEASEPVTSFLGSHSEAEAAELGRRVREGRIQIGGFHTTVCTEQLSEEVMARLFYLGLRHSPDLLGAPPGKTAQIDNVIGLTWPLATYIKEAGLSYLFHGHNGCCNSMRPASLEPLFYWQAPDGDDDHKVLVRSTVYGGYAGDSLGVASEAHISDAINKLGVATAWPYDSLLLQDGTDFQLATIDNATKIHNWNAKYSYPRLICSTMDMFFNDIAAQIKPGQIKSFSGDGNDEWAGLDPSDARALRIARRQGELTPTAEKFSTIATVLAGGGYPWLDIYQAYHRLLTWHEHGHGTDFVYQERENLQWYETELVEEREMVMESREFTGHALDVSLPKLTGMIKTSAQKSIVVFNPLAWKRTDVVRSSAAGLGGDFRIVDATSGKEVAHQALPNGQMMFIAADVPATGYKTFSILPGHSRVSASSGRGNTLENRFYRIQFDSKTGAITSIQDKDLNQELVDSSAPQRFNEYLYERYETDHITDPSKWYRVGSARLTPARGPVASVMTVKASAVGVESMQQTVILYNDLKRIDFALDMVKSPSGQNEERERSTSFKNQESVYVAMPFSIPDFTIKHELPGAVVEPIRQQFFGSTTAYYAVRHFTDISNTRYGVTVSSPDVALMEYGHPRSNPLLEIPMSSFHALLMENGHPRSYPLLEGAISSFDAFEKKMEYPSNSRLYLYLLDNTVDSGIRLDQRGPLSFAWSMRSHTGNWQQGDAAQFGWQVLNPLLPGIVEGRHSGTLPTTNSFLSIDKPNIACSTIKPAEANGSGIILRFNEIQGVATDATVSLPFLDKITAATETTLVEEDRPTPLQVLNGNQVSFSIRPFGVKTIRVIYKPDAPPSSVSGLEAQPVSDMEVKLSWHSSPEEAKRISHFNVYRGSTADFRPSLLNLVASPSATTYTDRAQLNYGGWINRRLEPDTTYYYRIAAVDRWNNQGPLSPPVAAKTLFTSEKNAVPMQVQALRAILVSDLSPSYNYVNLLFRTSPESDVHLYEIHRSTKPALEIDPSTRIGVADANGIVKGSKEYGHVPIDHRKTEYDHMMWQDDSVKPSTTYYYRVCAVDNAGQRGPCSVAASVRTK